MSDAGFDEAVYGKLLRKTLPRAIRSEEENERYLRVVEHLMSLGERITRRVTHDHGQLTVVA